MNFKSLLYIFDKRKKCLICGKPILKDNPLKCKYCSITCRNKRNYQKHKKYAEQWQRDRRGKWADNKLQCLICGKWYVQVGSHIYQTHHLTARQYREEYKLEVKKGITTPEFRKFKGDIALENGTYKNLKSGEKFWFSKGDKTAGKYKRSPITLERLKNLHKFRKEVK